jgi:NNP family nitrate/nitrite transporter-like MFS transporter
MQVSTLIGISGTFIIRLFLGPIAEAIGVRRCMAALLISCSIPGFALAGASTAFQVYAFRFFVGEFSFMLPPPRLALEHQS